MTTYTNKKNGKRYFVIARGIDCTNERDGTPVIVYSPEDKPDLVCVREEKEFNAKFDLESEPGS